MDLSLLKPILRPNLGHIACIAAIGLAVLGVVAIDTAGETAEYKKQMIFLPVGIFVMINAAAFPYKRLADLSGPLAIITLLMLIVVLVPGIGQERFGARRWFDLGVISFQPSELAKIVFVISLARYLRFRENYRTMMGLLQTLVITFIPMGLILVEPDLGTALIFLPVLFAMLVAAGAKLKHILLVVVLGLSATPALYPLLQPHQKTRIQDVISRMKGDETTAQNISFQGRTATRLVGAGGVSGHTETHAKNLVQHNDLPFPHNDMIFAVICARWGLVGGTIVFVLYLLLIFSSFSAAALTKDPFARLLVVGIVAIIFTQVFVNVGMTIGLLPITGMTLPLLSYGGSSLLMNCAMVGIVLSVAARRPLVMSKPAFEFDVASE